MRIFDRVPLKSVPANLITCGGLLLGVSAIGYAFSGQPEMAAWFIAICALVDKLDGTVARLLNATSDFGIQMDSFSDLITFGVAPACMVWNAAAQLDAGMWGSEGSVIGLPGSLILGLLCASYVVSAALRLAKFNVTTAEHPRMFHGLPTTLAGGLTSTLYLTAIELGFDQHAMMKVFPLLLALCAGLMVSNLPLPKLRKANSKVFFAGQLVLGVAVYVLIPLRMAFWVPLAVLVGYVSIGFPLGIRATIRAEADA